MHPWCDGIIIGESETLSHRCNTNFASSGTVGLPSKIANAGWQSCMTTGTELHAQIGQVKVGRPGDFLHALLGSCIGIGFLHRDKQVYGLAHCLLIEGTETDLTRSAVAMLIKPSILPGRDLLGVTPENRRRVHVFIAGGGNMTHGG